MRNRSRNRASKWLRLCLLATLLTTGAGLQAQISLPGGAGRGIEGVEGTVDRLGNGLRDATSPLTNAATGALGTLTQLADARLNRLGDFLRSHRNTVEADDTGQPARAHEVLLLDPDAAALSGANAAGYRLIEQGDLDGLGIAYARLATPQGTNLASALRQLRHLLPGKEISADQIHFPSGATHPSGNAAPTAPTPRGGTVGIIDGGVPPGPRITAQSAFASGGPVPNPHAEAIASLLAGAGTAHIVVADVYGRDPAGGNALAIARALAWMAGQRVPVVSISLVGPSNPLLARAIGSVQARGMIVTAAVGNDGAAAPPAFPASYKDVVAVTGVDGRGQVLFEAGRASHLDYAAPGADLTAIGAGGKVQKLRGTSFAAPLVAARLAALGQAGGGTSTILQRADNEATDKNRRTGRGILCASCRKGI
ncbi:S8 family serine peptidase [Novosphingobium terrae]|uniref:S8 family serine peptidase n=1 Tax=Novosphingobium terrae TaxID=2726189 RepID=UPI00197CBFAC|nr:S8 family serine peptidase [Novosphingobium terrae]